MKPLKNTIIKREKEIYIGNHLLGTYTNFSGELTFLIPITYYVNVRERIRG